MRKRRVQQFGVILAIVTITTVLALFPRSRSLTVFGQKTPPFKVWIKTSPCSINRQDWASVAQANPGEGGGGSFWYSANMIVEGATCARDVENCNFAAANVALAGVRADKRFFDFCCHDFSVYEHSQTKEMVVIRSKDDPGFGWRLVKGFLCCEEAAGIAGKPAGVCGATNANGNGNGGRIADGTDMPGGDYDHFEMSKADPNECLQACLGDFPDCKGFTYVKPGVQGKNAICWLKNKTGPTVAANCCSSGIVNGDGTVTPAGPGKNPPADDLIEIGKEGPIKIPTRLPGDVEIAPVGGTPRSTPFQPTPPVNQLSQGQRPCSSDEKAAFAKLIGTRATSRGKITIGGSCENATGTVLVTEYCENPDATYNKSLPRYTFNLTGRMDGASFAFKYTTSDSRNPSGNGYCSLHDDGISCSGISCL